MEEKALFQVQNFEEIPFGYIRIDKNSNYFYVEDNNKKYITKENIDLIKVFSINGIYVSIYNKSYYDIKNGLKVLDVNNIYCMNDDTCIYSNQDKNTKIIALNEILKLDGNKTSFLTEKDIDNIVNFENPVKKKKMTC